MGKAIEDGENTKAWSESWINPFADLIPSGSVLLQDQDMMVSDLLSRETKKWNKALVERLFPELTEYILSIRVSTTCVRDSFIWTQ